LKRRGVFGKVKDGMQKPNSKEKVVISLGGSLVVPNTGIDSDFLSRFNTFIRNKILENPQQQIFLVVGGGATTRHYQKAAREVIKHEITPDDLDWLGIHVTRLNAHLLRTIFRDIAHPVVLDRYDTIRKVEEPVVVASGWRPGWSTDYCAAMVCEDYNVDTVINLSNIEKVFTADPKINPDATPIDTISWEDFQRLVGVAWTPGMNVPFDPVATKKAADLGLKVVIMQGTNLENLDNYFAGREFVGTVIQ
jgi:uridylate kinase